jgi:myo-inositol-1(or 4)-monophosphatase
MTALAKRLETAIALATQAGDMALRLRPPPGAAVATLKGAQDWLTEADGAVERFLSDALAAAYPEDGFQGEETGKARAGKLRWVVDPIDGTANYARGAARFCVSLGLLDGDQPVVGVLVAPALGETFAARQGNGATLNGAPIRAATTPDLSRALIEMGWSLRRPNASFQLACNRVQAAGAALRMGGSGALGLADVAAGRIDGYAELHINLWDVAAGLVILAEAGAYVSPFMRPGVDTTGAPILACAPALVAALQQATGIDAAG